MPIYEYGCDSCGHKFEKLQPMNSSGADCPVCEQPARRAVSVFAAISPGAAGDDAPGLRCLPWAAADVAAVAAAAATRPRPPG